MYEHIILYSQVYQVNFALIILKSNPINFVVTFKLHLLRVGGYMGGGGRCTVITQHVFRACLAIELNQMQSKRDAIEIDCCCFWSAV